MSTWTTVTAEPAYTDNGASTQVSIAYDDDIVTFNLTWGKSSHRDFLVSDDEDIRAIARVLATAAGTCLADEEPEED